MLVVFVLYGLAFNVYVPPTNGDDVTYFQGALSIADGDGFKEQGKWIIDWPPVQSTLDAAAIWLTGIREYYLVKIINGIAVLLSLLLAYRLMVSESRCQPLLSCILIAIFPTSLIVGSGGQADFTFFAFSMGFFLLVAKLRRQRRISIAILCGALLGIASLTRWQGVLLGTCLVFQGVLVSHIFKRRSEVSVLKFPWLEFMAAAIGATIFLSWILWIAYCKELGMGGVSNYEYLAESIWAAPDPMEMFTGFLNLLTQFENVVLTVSPILAAPLALVVVFFLGFCIWGFILRIRSYGWLATDVFFLCTIILLSIYAYKESRYAIPIAPFLLDYFFRALHDLHSRWIRSMQWSDRLQTLHRRLFFATWIVGLVSFDAILIFYGDGESMGPACQFMLADNRDYLRGYHRDLYDVCKRIQKEYPNAVVASDKFHKQMIRYYSGLETHFVGFAPDARYQVFIQIDEACLPKRANILARGELEFPASLDGRLSNPRVSGFVTLWDVDAKTSP